MEQVEHQPRERSVPCLRCQASTWNNSAVCDRCALLALEVGPGKLFAVGPPTAAMRRADRDA